MSAVRGNLRTQRLGHADTPSSSGLIAACLLFASLAALIAYHRYAIAVILPSTAILFWVIPRWAFILIPLLASSLLPLFSLAGMPLDDLLVAAWLLYLPVRIRVRDIQPSMAVNLGTGTLMLAAVASAILTSQPKASLVALRFLSYAALAGILPSLRTQERRQVRLSLYLVGVIIAASVLAEQHGLLHVLPSYTDVESTTPRFGGLVGHPNFVAYAILLTAVIVLADSYTNWVKGPLVAFFVYASLATGSRMAFVGAALGVLTLGLRRIRVLAVLVGSVLLLSIVPSTLAQRVSNFWTTGGVGGNNNATFRLEQWRAALHLHSIWAPFGIGWNRTSQLLPDHLDAHSGYVQVLVELGLVGCLGFVFYLVGVLQIGRRYKAVGPAVLVFVVVTNASDPTVLYPAVAYTMLYGVLSTEVDRRHTNVARPSVAIGYRTP